ncbi:hypothetical protein EHS25_008311 [Saitozyma podzolica]|uniref:SH3 domain-containing protein n=1 Tax=Saitozyma podzolica TaxID=1890683 RepID=A0A427YP70_9TREE|nr:hypothetical protein EHS25_008311 [Saitozyma podzolica]
MTNSRTTLPPPTRSASGSNSAANFSPAPAEEELGVAEGQAQALYDYEGADTGDLSVQSGQIVNVLVKTSDDWWTCEDGNGQRGLVPAGYLKEI